jgi:signal-transduction protein with cAMP-binding, CBS, and nucleotidyltransferase domain
MIKKVKLLQLLGEEEVEELAAACTLVKYTAGASIISQGGTEAQEKFYMLKSGEVSHVR